MSTLEAELVKALMPGDEYLGLLVFEVPVGRASNLYLELPADNFGGEGQIRFDVPMSMVAGR